MQARYLLLLGLLAQSQGYRPHQATSPCRLIRPQSAVGRIELWNTQYNRLRTPTATLPSSTCLLLSSNEATPPSNSRNNPFRPRWPKNPLKSLKATTTKIVNSWSRLRARFQALSTRAKRLFLVQMFVLFLLFGGVSSKVVARNSPSTPTEISYGSFLKLIDDANNVHSKLPRIDVVRIGTDRISFRLYHSSTRTEDVPAKPVPPALKLLLDGDGSTSTAASAPSKPQRPARSTKESTSPLPQQLFVPAYTRKVSASTELVNQLRANDVTFAAAPSTTSVISVALRSCLIAFYILFLYRMYNVMSGNMGGGGGIGKSDAPGKLATASRDGPPVSFQDIQGIDQAKGEVMELVDVLKNPDKYALLGARAPTGLLLVGPPGTGKTLLAKATAAVAGVPLVYCSGSDFVEMFVGRGAARVRQLFERAQKLAPCIIFIDELDALGKARDFGSIGGGSPFGGSRSNDEAEQTLNQLLACMDGLDSSRQVCVLAATNRKNVLDPALTRPGRFDRIVQLQLPNAAGREQILRVHASKLPGFVEGTGVDGNRPNALGMDRSVDLSAVAAVTDGFSGAELEFLVNEAAIRAVRRVSSALQQGTVPHEDIVPHVEAGDFEESLRSFYETRSKSNGGGGVNDFFKNVWKP